MFTSKQLLILFCLSLTFAIPKFLFELTDISVTFDLLYILLILTVLEMLFPPIFQMVGLYNSRRYYNVLLSFLDLS